MTVQRTPNRCASRPINMPPTPEPNHASDPANAGMERVLPISAAIDFRPTVAIKGAPNDMPMQMSEIVAMSQEVRESSNAAEGWDEDERAMV